MKLGELHELQLPSTGTGHEPHVLVPLLPIIISSITTWVLYLIFQVV
jgi:hypothetical protein